MSYELQKILAIESYKATDLHKFVKICRYIDQTSRDVDNKSRREDFNNDDNVDDAEREEIIVIVNSNQNNDRSISRSRFEISEFESESNSRAITQSSEDQMNSLNCYNYEKFDHFSRNCRQFRKSMNSNNFVREMNVQKKNDAEKNLEQNSRKE
jgi:hypothetical protein